MEREERAARRRHQMQACAAAAWLRDRSGLCKPSQLSHDSGVHFTYIRSLDFLFGRAWRSMRPRTRPPEVSIATTLPRTS